MSEFKVGDKVVLREDSEYYGKPGQLPDGIVGTVVKALLGFGCDEFEVEWSDGSCTKSNMYYWDDLKMYLVGASVQEAYSTTKWTGNHYDNWYTLSDEDKTLGKVKIDAYFVNKMWKLNEKDDTGCLFHNLKTIARFGDKNPTERELKALYNQTKRMAELYGVNLDE